MIYFFIKKQYVSILEIEMKIICQETNYIISYLLVIQYKFVKLTLI